MRASQLVGGVLLAMLAASLTGCGALVSVYDEAVRGYATSVHQVIDPIKVTDGVPADVDLGAAMAKLRDVTSQTETYLATVEVPAQHQGSHQHLMEAIDAFSAGSQAIVDGYAAADWDGVGRGSSQISRGLTAMNAWLDEYEAE